MTVLKSADTWLRESFQSAPKATEARLGPLTQTVGIRGSSLNSPLTWRVQLCFVFVADREGGQPPVTHPVLRGKAVVYFKVISVQNVLSSVAVWSQAPHIFVHRGILSGENLESFVWRYWALPSLVSLGLTSDGSGYRSGDVMGGGPC